MKKALSFTFETIAHLIPLGVYPTIMPRDLIDFFYHAVSNDAMPHVRHLYPVVSVADFEAALLNLKENYTFVEYSQVHDYMLKGKSLPPNAVHLSFDDGYAECFSVVRPLLLKYDIPCTFFLTTGLIDNHILFYRNKQSLCVDRLMVLAFQSAMFESIPGDPPLNKRSAFISWFKNLRLSDEPVIDEICRVLDVNWFVFLQENQPYLTTKQIQQMYADGFTLGAHTLTHRKLMDLPSDVIETEIADSCQAVTAITGQKVVPFSFPHSGWGLDRGLLSDIRGRHSEIGLLFDTKGVRKDVDFIHNRVWAERPLTPERILHPIPDVLHNAYQEAWVDEMMELGRKLTK